MKNSTILFIILLLFTFACNKADDTVPPEAEGRNISMEVRPNETNSDYALLDRKHYVVWNDQNQIDKLLLFIGGTFSAPKNYRLICDHAATLGFHVISLSYPNNVAAAPLGPSADPLIFDNYREEVCFGTEGSAVVDVDVLNSIHSRTINLLQYLSVNNSDQDWGQYLIGANEPNWEKIIVAGHSQGAGHACYLGKKNEVDRVVMFSGPNDYSSFYSESANWLRESGATALERQFALLHEADEIVSFENQVANLRGLGLLASGENPLLVDNLTAPYENANALSINSSGISNHSVPIGSNASMPDIWNYLLGEE